jgi:hypothetical protein
MPQKQSIAYGVLLNYQGLGHGTKASVMNAGSLTKNGA